MNREILQQALHHLVRLADDLRRIPSDIAQTISALEAELAKPEQDINILHIGTDVIEEGMHLIVRRGNEIIHSQFYEAPKRQWVGLTDDEFSKTYNDLYTQYTRDDVNIADFILIARAVESLVKEKNT